MKFIIFDDKGSLKSKRVYPRKAIKTKWEIIEERLQKLANAKKEKKVIVPDYIKVLQTLRLRKGIGQKEIAKALKTRQSAISRFENGTGNVTLTFLRKYAKLLDTGIDISIRGND